MRKLTDFIVDKRYYILTIFIILTGISFFLAKQVKINHDITKYLPNSSETRTGMNIMEDEFSNINNSTLNIMIKNLSKKEKQQAYNYLNKLDKVKDVSYDDSSKYNKNNYTLYELTFDIQADSKEAHNIYEKIADHFGDDLVDTSGDISSYNKTVLPFYIVVLAVCSALVILIIMCNSYVEPFLFLISILIAVFLNKGSNNIFNNVSNITDSIAAILQMALSMDYSIMLMNRYQQEKTHQKDKVEAMKAALNNAFKSISSSSVTTIVGLLALVFMSFTIGRDLGLVLAKGVLFSLLSIFTCLPALILMCDKLITKTKKKSPIFKMKLLPKYAYKFRHVVLILFILVFALSYNLKGNLGILYTESGTDEIDKTFQINNQIAVIYNNKYEEEITKYCRGLNNKKIKDVLCYGNTINEPVTYNNLNQKIKDLGSNVKTDDYLLKIIYYIYYNQDESNKLTFKEFINFIKKDVYKNSKMDDKLSQDMKNNIDKLENLTDINLINQLRTSDNIANLLNLDKNDIDKLLIYYNSLNNSEKISISEFTNFMNNFVLKNEEYASSVDKSTKDNLNKITKFTNKNNVTKKLSIKEVSQLFAIDESLVSSLYTYYVSLNNNLDKLSLSDFGNFVQNNILNNDLYSSSFSEQTKVDIQNLVTFSNKEFINQSISALKMSTLLGVDENLVNNLYLLIYSNKDNGTTFTIKDLVENIIYLKNSEYKDYLKNLPAEKLSYLTEEQLNSTTTYTASEMAEIFQVDVKDMYQIYALIDFIKGNTNNWVVSPYEFISFIVMNMDNQMISDNLIESEIKQIQKLYFIMSSTNNDIKFSYGEMAQNLNIDETLVKNIYSLYFVDETKLTAKEFGEFILNHQNDQLLKGKLSSNTIIELTLVNKIIDSTINNITYSSDELANLLNIDKNKINLIYSLYEINYKQKEITVSVKDFVNFLLNDVLPNPEYNSNFNEESKNKLTTVNKIINNSLNNTKYTKDEMFMILTLLADDLDKDLLDLVYIYYGSQNEFNSKWTLTIEQFVNYLNKDILTDKRFNDFIDDDMKKNIIDAEDTVNDAKKMLVGKKYSRLVLNTNFEPEGEDTFLFIKKMKNDLDKNVKDFYVIGNSSMAYEMSHTFQNELNFITILTMIFIFIVVAFTFKSILIPIVLVLLIQCAVYLTMGILSFSGSSVYFISILIVQSILMGATIDYAILYTSYYLEARSTLDIKNSIKQAYNNSIHTILTSASILIIVTLIVGYFASAVAAKICKTLSHGTLCSSILILLLLPAILASLDKFIVKKK